ncbi:hypothetical protein BofuT4_P048780.1 [Botrytis cinerea T4]|uniref:Uncharacterized protein n=1 Tax=Botryotinia fuckeliana (strain T4) TaxID=999810 RepID=G2XZH3_BOTF4|nr:hypothetical protein BofuT4_P048780.1 [Botrytis cinerea T4]
MNQIARIMNIDTQSEQQIRDRQATNTKFSSTYIVAFGPYMDPQSHPYPIFTTCESKIHPYSFIGHDVGGNPLIGASKPGIVHDDTLPAFDQPLRNYCKTSVAGEDKNWENCQDLCLEFHFERDGLKVVEQCPIYIFTAVHLNELGEQEGNFPDGLICDQLDSSL